MNAVRNSCGSVILSANDKQIGGNHYKDQPIEPWDYIVQNNLGYLEGNAIKYITRWRAKGGVADLHKAIHYIEKLIETSAPEGNTIVNCTVKN